MATDRGVPDITVVVPTRNRRVLLERLLARLDAIDDDLTYELVVVDEASSDATPAFLGAWRPQRLRLRVIRHEPPQGPSRARNAGLAAATAPYVAFIDDDDLTAPDRLRRQRELIRSTGARWSACARVDIDDDLAVIGYGTCPPVENLLEQLLAFNVMPAAGQGLLIERSLADELGGFDPAMDGAEDWDLCIRLARTGAPAFLDEPLVGYRTGVASMSSDTTKMDRAIATVLTKHETLRDELGVEPAWFEIHRSLLFSDVRTSRRAGARRAWRMLRAQPSAKTLARCAWILAMPDKAAERSRGARISQVPAAWRAQAERWLRAS